MTRHPDPKSKTTTVIVRANNEAEIQQIRAFKKLCVQDDLEIRKVILQKINDFLREHNWPPGNPQTLLEVFDVKAVISNPQCGISGCSKPAIDELFHELMKVYRCRKHKFFRLPWSTYGTKPIKDLRKT